MVGSDRVRLVFAVVSVVFAATLLVSYAAPRVTGDELRDESSLERAFETGDRDPIVEPARTSPSSRRTRRRSSPTRDPAPRACGTGRPRPGREYLLSQQLPHAVLGRRPRPRNRRDRGVRLRRPPRRRRVRRRDSLYAQRRRARQPHDRRRNRRLQPDHARQALDPVARRRPDRRTPPAFRRRHRPRPGLRRQHHEPVRRVGSGTPSRSSTPRAAAPTPRTGPT